MRIFIFLSLVLFYSCNKKPINEHIYLLCEVKGESSYDFEKGTPINDNINVEINSTVYSTEVKANGGENTSFSINGYKENNNINWDKSNGDQWEVGSHPESKTTLDDYVLINRNTGIISYSHQFDRIRTTFSGKCAKATEKKF